MMDPPKSKTTMRISTNIGTASQYANSPMTVIELKGRTPQEKGDHYLQLSLGALKELSDLLEDKRLSESEKATYNEIYKGTMTQYDDLVQLRDQISSRKKYFGKFLVNLFVRDSKVGRFHKMSYWTYSTIRRTSDEVHRRLLGVKDNILAASGSIQENNVSICEENPRDMVENHTLVRDLPPNEPLRGFGLDLQTESEENDALRMLHRIATLVGGGKGDDDDDDDDGSSTAVPSESRPPSPSPSLTIIHNYNHNNINNSVLAFHSEVMGTAINSGMD